MLDRCSIASRSIEPLLLWTPLDSFSIAISRLFNSRHLFIHHETGISIYRVCFFFSSFLPNLSQQFMSPHLPKLFSITPNLFPKFFSASRSFLHLVWSYSLYSYHAFHFFFFYLTFGTFLKNLGFFKIDEFSTNFWDGFCVNDPKWSCIVDVCYICWIVVCCYVWIGLSPWWF